MKINKLIFRNFILINNLLIESIKQLYKIIFTNLNINKNNKKCNVQNI